MKNLKITLITMICIFAFACKKEKTRDTTNAIFYKNSPNLQDNLISEVNMPEKNSVAYFYGSSDSLGAPASINSISYKINNNDTIVNIILDVEKRPQIIYFSNNSGTKLNQLIKFEYISPDSTIISIYNYDWINNTDSLLFQSRGKGDKSIKTYGLRLNSTTDLFSDLTTTLLTTIGAAGIACAATAVLPGMLFYVAGFSLAQSALAGVISAVTLISSTSHANQQLQSQKNPKAPVSPTSSYIPNPTGTPQNPSGSNTVTDIDGNIYHTITIGTQTWMVENLKTTRYNDGETIPNISDTTQWYEYGNGTVDGELDIEKAAWCYYYNSSNNNIPYGKLYNWHAVKTGKLAPIGWHVPTKSEWETLVNYLGGDNFAVGKMQTTTLWDSPNVGATNSSGFTAVPSGIRGNHGGFTGKGTFTIWWTSTQSNSYSHWAWSIFLDNTDGIVIQEGTKTPGLAIRCIKD